jgi:hypothetical protein
LAPPALQLSGLVAYSTNRPTNRTTRKLVDQIGSIALVGHSSATWTTNRD